MGRMTVIDIFCGAGGFSEGFRQYDFDILLGVDNWEPAIKSFNHNFNLNCPIKNVLDFEDGISDIEALPDSNVIVGSPPCVSFSNSNKSGKADKSMGVRLTEIFLKIVAVKKYQPGSILDAWLMENVPNSTKYLAEKYTFSDLGLSAWARRNGYDPRKIAIKIKGNSILINSVNYGSPQKRNRLITGELLSQGKIVIPEETHGKDLTYGYKTLKEVKSKLPKPNSAKKSIVVVDPIYNWITIRQDQLTDHFYDSGLYKSHWKNSFFMKRNHPYMGRMAFPEDENNPSRTITATQIKTSREAIIYKSEYNRVGDGEYRLPTIREMACLMGFPITYQFLGGGIGSKARLVGNAVCPTVSSAFARMIRKEHSYPNLSKPQIKGLQVIDQFYNLNTYKEIQFNAPPQKKIGARFRRHPFKHGNITVTLSNYNIESNDLERRWITSIQYGNGAGFPTINIPDRYFTEIEHIVKKQDQLDFLGSLKNGFSSRIGSADDLQLMHERQESLNGYLEPSELVEELAKMILRSQDENELFEQGHNKIFDNKEAVPVVQLLALYGINYISSIANSK